MDSIVNDEYLIEEILGQSARPNTNHRRLVNKLAVELDKYFGNKCEVAVESELYLTNEPIESFTQDGLALHRLYKDTKYVEPDISLYCDKRQIFLRGCVGIPQLIIEVLSPSNSDDDTIVKKALYEKYKVPEYWIVSPMSKKVFIYVMQDDRYVEVYNGDFSDVFTSLRFEGLKIDLSEVELI